MQAIHITAPSLDDFQRMEVASPAAPAPGRVLVRMKAASLNFADLAVATGHYPGAVYPNVPLADGAGEVVAVGDGVWQVASGDRVAVAVKPRWFAGETSAARADLMRGATAPGALTELLDVAADGVVKAAEHLTWAQLGTLPVCAMTAWKALENAAIGPASTVVVLGTGGVSISALQLAKARGARVLVTSSSSAKLERARALGADETVNHREQPDWDQAVLAWTRGRGADLVIDPVGGAGLQRTLDAVRQGGTVALLGFLGGVSAELDLLPLIFKEIRLQGANGGSAEDLAHAMAAIAAHRIEPVVHAEFGLAELPAAFKLMGEGGHFGKIAVRLDW